MCFGGHVIPRTLDSSARIGLGGQGIPSRQGQGSRQWTARRDRQTQAQLFKQGREVAWP